MIWSSQLIVHVYKKWSGKEKKNKYSGEDYKIWYVVTVDNLNDITYNGYIELEGKFVEITYNVYRVGR